MTWALHRACASPITLVCSLCAQIERSLELDVEGRQTRNKQWAEYQQQQQQSEGGDGA